MGFIVATTLANLADGIKTRLATISSLNVYATFEELPHDPAAEVIFRERRRDSAGGSQVATFVVEVSVTAEDRGWAEAIARVRTFLEPEGSTSIEAAIYADDTLGGLADWCAVTRVEGEKRIQFGDGWRIMGRVHVEVEYDP